jgi:hypothetical protein
LPGSGHHSDAKCGCKKPSFTLAALEVEAMFARARTMALALAILTAAPAGTGGAPAAAKSLSGLAVKPKPVCLRPRRPPDTAVPAPEVVSTFPAEGAVVRPGLLVLRFTFNVAMSCDGLFQRLDRLAMPCDGGDVQWTDLTYDRTTIRMPCFVRPDTRYGIWMNPGRGRELNSRRFSSLAGRPLESFRLTFSTSSGPSVGDIKEAETEDKDWPPSAR